jgi:hypothetical protein
VTEPDPVAALAGQVEQLRADLARYTGETGSLRARLDQGSGREALIRLEIKKLGEKIDDATAKRKADDPPAPAWLGLSPDEHADRLGELRAWVEQVGFGQYPGYFERLKKCWSAHREAVIELSTLMTEWVRIYGDPGNGPLQDALVWNDKWLPGVLARLDSSIRCDATGCQAEQAARQERLLPLR